MKILIYCSHPAQFWFYRNVITGLINKKHETKLIIRSKDVLEDVVRSENMKYVNILPEGRKNNIFGIGLGLLRRLIRINKIIQSFKPDLLLGSDPSISQLARVHRKPGLITVEDDVKIIPKLAFLAYPFAKYLIVPAPCQVGRWVSKKIGYQGYMKLAYLHPSYFIPDKKHINNIHSPYYLIRLSGLTAHHDFGISGIDFSLLDTLLNLLGEKGHVYITSENVLPSRYDKYKLKINPVNIHHFLFFAEILISDSQSMSVEAAMLGTASIRFSSFAGKISVLEELEHRYGLTFGINPDNPELLYSKLKELLEIKEIKSEFMRRRARMLSEKIDVTSFLLWFIENYPESASIMKENPDYQYNFR